jgi:hypothetical protein
VFEPKVAMHRTISSDAKFSTKKPTVRKYKSPLVVHFQIFGHYFPKKAMQAKNSYIG